MKSFSLTLRGFLIVLATAATFAAGKDAVPSKRPNFVFILIDDMGWGDLSCFGNQSIKTPNLDRLAQEGVRFEQFYVASPICSPSRTGFHTGQYPARWRLTSYLDNRQKNQERGMAQWLDPKAPSLARLLQQSGYATGHFGKWHLGGQRDVGDAPLIPEYGFDESLTQFEGLGDRVLAMLDDRNGKTPRKMPLGVGSEKLGRGRVTWVDRAEVTSSFTRRALEFIHKAEQAHKPFFVQIWPDDVHSPFFPTKELRGKGTKKDLYHGALVGMDRQLGEFLEAIRSNENLRSNTLVVVCSDNGPEPGAGSAGPFRGHKGTLYEGGIRSPLIVWGPGIVPEGARGSVDKLSMITAVDFAPSVLAIAGISAPPQIKFDGIDRSRSLTKTEKGIIFSEPRLQPMFWIRPPDRPGEPGVDWPDFAVRLGDLKLLMNEDGSGVELYDVMKDRGETNNLAAENPDLVEKLKQSVTEWQATLPNGQKNG
jgi:uncharacterized sulfatase